MVHDIANNTFYFVHEVECFESAWGRINITMGACATRAATS